MNPYDPSNSFLISSIPLNANQFEADSEALNSVPSILVWNTALNVFQRINTKTNEVLNESSSPVASPYKVLALTLTQAGIAVPTFNALQDDFTTSGDTIAYSRVGVGRYRITSTLGSFTADKLYCQPFTDFVGNGEVLLMISDGADVWYYSCFRVSDSIIEIKVVAADKVTYAELSTALTGSTLYFPEIRVYS